MPGGCLSLSIISAPSAPAPAEAAAEVAAELEVAREHLKGSLMLALEQTSSRMSNLARQEIYLDRLQSLSETLKRVGAVTRNQVHRLARELTRGQRIGLAAIGRTRRLRLTPEALQL